MLRDARHFYAAHILDRYAQTRPSLVTLRQLVVFGKQLDLPRLLRSGNHVRRELPVRIAHRIRALQHLPFAVMSHPRLQLIYHTYWRLFDTLRAVEEIRTLEDNTAFCKILTQLLRDGLIVIPELVVGVRESVDELGVEAGEKFLQETLRGRISRRVLSEQHLALTEQWYEGRERGEEVQLRSATRFGSVETSCNAGQLVERCRQSALEATRNEILDNSALPEVVVDGTMEATLACIPDHVEYILHELLRNALRASVLQSSNVSKDHQQIRG